MFVKLVYAVGMCALLLIAQCAYADASRGSQPLTTHQMLVAYERGHDLVSRAMKLSRWHLRLANQRGDDVIAFRRDWRQKVSNLLGREHNIFAVSIFARAIHHHKRDKGVSLTTNDLLVEAFDAAVIRIESFDDRVAVDVLEELQEELTLGGGEKSMVSEALYRAKRRLKTTSRN